MGDDVVVGRILGPFGVQGEVKLSAADPAALVSGLAVRLVPEHGQSLHSVVESIRPHQHAFVARLRGVADIDTAGVLRGAAIMAVREDLPRLAPDRYRDADLRGMQVIDEKLGVLGDVREVRRYPSCDMLVVGEKMLLVPMLRAYGIDVDATAHVIRISLPDGFDELI